MNNTESINKNTPKKNTPISPKENNQQKNSSNIKKDSKATDFIIKEIDLKKRNELYYLAEKILINEAPIIPIKNSISIYLLNNKIKGIYPNVMDIHPLKEVYYVK